MRRLIGMLALVLSPLGHAQAQGVDTEVGRGLATQWCANCHHVGAAGGASASDAVPPFAAIAARPGATIDGIATFLRTPHAGMPDHGLTLRQARELAAYLLAQKPR